MRTAFLSLPHPLKQTLVFDSLGLCLIHFLFLYHSPLYKHQTYFWEPCLLFSQKCLLEWILLHSLFLALPAFKLDVLVDTSALLANAVLHDKPLSLRNLPLWLSFLISSTPPGGTSTFDLLVSTVLLYCSYGVHDKLQINMCSAFSQRSCSSTNLSLHHLTQSCVCENYYSVCATLFLIM